LLSPGRELKLLIRHNSDALVLTIFALFLYLPLMSCSFDEWDSYNFAFALKEYDISLSKPHPPGYPVYAFVGRVVLSLTGSPLTALTLVSAISGALVIAAVCLLTRMMYDRKTAVLVSLAMMFTPGLWIGSESALTDSLFTFLLIMALCFLYSGTKGRNGMTQGSWFTYGLAVGVRPNPASLTFLPLWFLITIRTVKNVGRMVAAIKGALLFVASCLIWFIPMILRTGWDRYWVAMHQQLIGSSTVEFVWARTHGLDPTGRLEHIIMQILVFSLGGAFPGADPIFASTNPSVHLHGVFLIVAIAMCIANMRRIVAKSFLFLWVVPYFVFTYLFGTLNYPRYYLPIIPAIVIVLIPSIIVETRSIFQRLQIPQRTSRLWCNIHLVFAVVLLVSFFVHTFPLAVIIHNQPAPTRQLFEYVTVNYPPGTTLIEFHEHRVFQFYENGIQYLHCRLDEKKVMDVLSSISSDRSLLITTSAYEYLASHTAVAELRVDFLIEFFRDPHVVVEDHRICLYRITSARLR